MPRPKRDAESSSSNSAIAAVSPEATAALLSGLSGRRAAVSSHGDVIPETLDHLADRGMRFNDRFDCKKGSTWVLRPDGTQFTDAWYVAPGL